MLTGKGAKARPVVNQKQFDHALSAIPNFSSLNRQWMIAYNRVFGEHRVYIVNGMLFDEQYMVATLRKGLSSYPLLAIWCQKEPRVITTSDDTTDSDNNQPDGTDDPNARHVIVLLRGDGIGGKFSIQPGNMPGPLAELLSDTSVTFVCYDAHQIKVDFSATVGTYFTNKYHNHHDIKPLLEAVMECGSNFFGTNLVRSDVDSIWKLIVERYCSFFNFRKMIPINKTFVIKYTDN